MLREKLREVGGGQLGKFIYFLVTAERFSLQGWVSPPKAQSLLMNGGCGPLSFMKSVVMVMLTFVVYKIVRVGRYYLMNSV